MKNLITRSITGLIFIAVILGSTITPASFNGLFLIITILTLLEFYRLVNDRVSNWILYADILGGTYLAGTIILIPETEAGFPLIYACVPYFCYLIYSFIVRLYLKEENPIASWGTSFMGQLYIALPLGLLAFVAHPPFSSEHLTTAYDPMMIIAFFTFIWINDTGAYVIGSTFGKHRLFERISPKKSWEGFLGGLFFAMILGWVWAIYHPIFSPAKWVGLGIVISVFSTLGDLCESLLKRTLNVKDSGNILPGHGGLLDRFDSVLLASPATIVYLYLLAAA